MTARDWVSFWDDKHSIYVNARHHEAHYRRIAYDLRPYVRNGGAVLDYGCGEALSADRIAAQAGGLILCEAAPHVRAAIAARFAGNGKIEVRTPQDVAALPPASLDLIVMHSVAQYLAPDTLDELLRTFRRLAKPDGLFILGDVIPTKVSAATDALRRAGAVALRRARPLPARGGVRPRPHSVFELLDAAQHARPRPLRRRRGHRAAQRCGLLRRAGAPEHRPQPGPDDVSGATGLITWAAPGTRPAAR
jgi:SAM-dependent methyltransferase